ncbi:uncharacterized protein A1O9_06794, partial [Exophiala aquamarina CBS 119918]
TGDNVGIAAIGQTSTYSSHTLRQGDAVGSVIDHKSQDPTTYKMPEHTFGQGTSASGEKSTSGVPAGAAGTAASRAFNKHNDQSTDIADLPLASNIPGAFPKESAHDTVTLPPVNRPIDHEAGRAAPISTESNSAAAPARTEPNQTGTFGRILGAVGLGGAAAGTGIAASKAAEDRSQAVIDTPEQPTTTTGVGSYTAPTQSGPSPSHHRKESIPTTAYPAGPGSPSPIHAPVGGTRGSTASEDKSHAGRNAGLAAAGLGAGAGALGAHEYGKSREGPADTPTSSTLSGTLPTMDSALPNSGQTTSAFPSNSQSTTSSALPSSTRTGTEQGVPRDQHLTTSGQDQQASGYGKTAAAAGLGAGAGAAGVSALQHDRKPDSTDRFAEQPWQSNQTPSHPSTGGTSDLVREQASSQTPVTSAIGTSSTDPTTGDSHAGRNAALAGAAGAGPGAYGAHEYGKRSAGQDAANQPSTGGTSNLVREQAASQTPVTSTRDNVGTGPTKDDSHTGRNAALAGAAGAGAYGAHEHSKHQAEEDAPRRQKDLAEQEAARQKQFERDQKAAEKQAHKEEKQHEKDLKKQEKAEEKAHQKDHKKEEKAHDKAVAKEEKHHQKELDKEDEAEHKRREKEAAALAGTAGAGGAAYAAHRHDADANNKGKLSSENDHERNKLHKDAPEKKPSLFKRIFRRRKNKDTGDSEEYSTDEEDNTGSTGTTAAGLSAGAAGAGLAGSKSDKGYDVASGGPQKPSYNPLHKDD